MSLTLTRVEKVVTALFFLTIVAFLFCAYYDLMFLIAGSSDAFKLSVIGQIPRWLIVAFHLIMLAAGIVSRALFMHGSWSVMPRRLRDICRTICGLRRDVPPYGHCMRQH